MIKQECCSQLAKQRAKELETFLSHFWDFLFKSLIRFFNENVNGKFDSIVNLKTFAKEIEPFLDFFHAYL